MTSVKNIASCQERHFETIYNNVNRSVVFIDTVSAELLHWQGGLLKLINAGATGLKEFSSFESGSKDQKKGVFIINSLLEGVTREILKDIIQASSFQYVVVFTSQSAALHVYSRSGVVEEESDFFDQVEERLLEWMGNMNFTAEVFHVPLSSINLGNSLFLTPGYSRLFPLIGSDLHQIELQYNSKHEKNEMRDFGTLKDVDFPSLPKELQMFYKSFISSLDTLLSDLGVKEDIFSMGYTSAILASELEAYPPAKTRRKTLSDRASVVFIDRTLDLASVTSYNTESLLDKIQQVLPRLPGHVTDVSVDMSSLCKVHREHGAETISSGCLATQTVSQSHLQTLITGRNKEALMEVNRQLIEAASSCNLPVSLTGKPTRVSAEQLNATLSVFRGKYKEISKHLDWLQVSMATYQTLSNPIMHHCDEMISVEKGLLQSLVDPDGPGALSQVLQMIQKKKEKEDTWMYSLDDILCILVFVYSLGGSTLLSQMDEEAALQEMILDRVIQEKSQLPPLMRSIVGDIVTDRSIVSDILEDLWEKLSSISVSREHLSQFKNVLDPGSAISPASQNPLLKQLVEAMLDPDKPEIVDLEFKSSGLRDKLKSGFGLFRGVSKPRPSDHPLMILFIVGGVNCTEVKQIKDVFNHYKPGCQIMVGSTRLLSPRETVMSALCQNNIIPFEIS
ncbi:sec1 family domain-containing protein 2-like [Ruditapes philippinarum]|uniref:sec1 family domain-containing protein 2-like n=1 Tax=Ruditapes philippinarum TaxID=129788 RepID=UPI00295BFA12|nr:sec1 family domain-containing protein 2-like [Ruditapes philippinarum]XP_060569472.1 sec1 family domain-containing protein 2-like [Ruditapes philippinarum]